MSITQQYLLDTYRARQHGDPTPPAPGAHDWQVMRELPDHRRFRAVLTGRPARGRVGARVRARVRAVRIAWFGRPGRPGRLGHSDRPDLIGRSRPRSPSGPSGGVGPARTAGPVISGECAPRTP
ncbi:hypothetical protein OG288_23875 [Streptomyces tauricus]|uniref:Uncharacterized protein n=1 Tax=Streptomyces tauricus TaxID=68274 RepID=A0ABZ1JUC8_9ACTN|nr:hypothetical protein [Streptomyces tauricus]